MTWAEAWRDGVVGLVLRVDAAVCIVMLLTLAISLRHISRCDRPWDCELVQAFRLVDLALLLGVIGVSVWGFANLPS